MLLCFLCITFHLCYCAFPFCCFHNEQQPKLHAAACSPSLITIALLLCLTCISDANNKNCIYITVFTDVWKNFIAFSNTGHLRSVVFFPLLIFLSLLCVFISNKIISICCVLHSLCCEYILSHDIKGKLHSIAMHFNACAPQEKFHVVVHSNPCAPHTKVSTLPLFYVLPSSSLTRCCAFYCFSFFLSCCCTSHFNAAPFPSSHFCAYCIAYVIKKKHYIFFDIAAYYISEELTKKKSFALCCATIHPPRNLHALQTFLLCFYGRFNSISLPL